MLFKNSNYFFNKETLQKPNTLQKYSSRISTYLTNNKFAIYYISWPFVNSFIAYFKVNLLTDKINDSSKV